MATFFESAAEISQLQQHLFLDHTRSHPVASIIVESRTRMPEYFISTDRGALDVEFIVRSLQSTYWAGDRLRETIIASLASSICFGVYEADSRHQVGFARIVTDGATFTWLCDVFVAAPHRGRGLGKRLVTEVLSHPSVAGTRVYLGTKYANGLYAQFGFQRWELMRYACEKHDSEAQPSSLRGG